MKNVIVRLVFSCQDAIIQTRKSTRSVADASWLMNQFINEPTSPVYRRERFFIQICARFVPIKKGNPFFVWNIGFRTLFPRSDEGEEKGRIWTIYGLCLSGVNMKC